MRTYRIALLGAGVVGSGVINILRDNMELIRMRIRERTGEQVQIEIAKILVRSLDKYEMRDTRVLTTDIREILEDESISLVIEVMGGVSPALEYMKEAIRKGKHLVSANKMMIAEYGQELEAMAANHHVAFRYEASVAGTIPVIRVIRDCLAANHIYGMKGIINGTTNFILTKMTQDHKELEEALEIAQKKGFAEADPTSDLEGFDAAYKMAILSRLSYGMPVSSEQIKRVSMKQVTQEDVKRAEKKGRVIKYLAKSRLINGSPLIEVGPEEIPLDHPLARVNDAMNAVTIYCDKAGRIQLQGEGAGAEPTASAVISDLLTIIEQEYQVCF